MPMQPPIAPAPKYMKDRVDGSARKEQQKTFLKEELKEKLNYKDNQVKIQLKWLLLKNLKQHKL